MNTNKGVIYATVAYVMWGIFPLFFYAIKVVPATQIVSHRIIWSFIFLAFLILVRSEFGALKSALSPRILLIYTVAGILLSINWLTYVWGVNSGYVVETSLGYFINPLVSVLLGVIFLREKLRLVQWVPIGLAAAGVAYLTVNYGSLPWIALVLAVTFGLYGFIKKVAPLGSLHGLTLETGAIFLPAVGFLIIEEARGVGAFGHTGLITGLLLCLTGIVTAVPLLLFASGARRVPLSTLGLLQYITPTLQFLVGVYILGEPFTFSRLIGFAMIWMALFIFSTESFINRRKAMPVLEADALRGQIT